jgi:hypothetical protein
VADDTRRYAQAVLEGRQQAAPYRTLGLLTAEDARLINTATNATVEGFDYALDRFAVHHVQGAHGIGGESRATQRPVTAADYAMLPRLLNDGAEPQSAGRARKTGNPLIKRRLIVGEEAFEAVFEVRKGRKMLALETFYIMTLKKGGAGE